MYCMFDRDEQCFSDCDNCVRNKTVTCRVCGEQFVDSEPEYYGAGEGPICPDCLDKEEADEEDIYVCDCCGKVVEKNNFVRTFYGDCYCLDCDQFCE